MITNCSNNIHSLQPLWSIFQLTLIHIPFSTIGVVSNIPVLNIQCNPCCPPQCISIWDRRVAKMCLRLSIVSVAVLVWLRQHITVGVWETTTLDTILSHKSYSVLS